MAAGAFFERGRYLDTPLDRRERLGRKSFFRGFGGTRSTQAVAGEIDPVRDTVAGRLVVEGFHSKGLAIPKWSLLSDSVSLRNLLLATGRYLSVMPG